MKQSLRIYSNQPEVSPVENLGVPRPTLFLTPMASLKIPNITLRFNYLIERPTDLRHNLVMMFMDMVYYSKEVKTDTHKKKKHIGEGPETQNMVLLCGGH